MTAEDVKKLLESMGIKIDGLKDETIAKAKEWLETQKAGLDTKTRREVRAFWIVCTGLGIFLGGCGGWLLCGFFG